MNSDFFNILFSTILAATAIIGTSVSMHYSRLSMKEMVHQKELQYRPLIKQLFLATHSERLIELLKIQNIGTGYALNARVWWKILEHNEDFWGKSIVEEIIPFGILGINEIVTVNLDASKRLFPALDEYCRFQTDKIHQLSYLILYEDIFEHKYIFKAEYKLHDGTISLLSNFQIARLATNDELAKIGDNK